MTELDRSYGTYYNCNFISSTVVEITGVYIAPGDQEPAMLEVSITIGALPPKTFTIPPEKLDVQNLHKICPQIRCGSSRKKELFNELLSSQYINILEEIQRGDL